MYVIALLSNKAFLGNNFSKNFPIEIERERERGVNARSVLVFRYTIIIAYHLRCHLSHRVLERRCTSKWVESSRVLDRISRIKVSLLSEDRWETFNPIPLLSRIGSFVTEKRGMFGRYLLPGRSYKILGHIRVSLSFLASSLALTDASNFVRISVRTTLSCLFSN